MLRIYFDGNAGDQAGRADLGIPGSLADIALLEGRLADGMRVLLYDNEELEVEAILEFDHHYGVWMGVPQWDTLRLLPVFPDHPQAAQ